MTASLFAGLDYPRNEDELLYMLHREPTPTEKYPLETQCLAYLARVGNWPMGYLCQRCGKALSSIVRSKDRAVCLNPKCLGHDESVISNTLLRSTDKKHLLAWILATWYIAEGMRPTGKRQLTSRLNISEKLAGRMLNVFYCAISEINNSLTFQEPERVHTLLPCNGQVFPVVFLIDRTGGKRRIRAEVQSTKSILREPSNHKRAAANLVTLWENHLVTMEILPVKEKDFHSCLEKFVFYQNHNHVKRRGLVFYKLLQALMRISPNATKTPRIITLPT